MRRILARSASLALAASLVLSAGLLVAGATAAAAATCTGTVQITSFAFDPATVAPGQSSTATVTVQNCTAQAQTTSVMWVARYIGATTGIPAGCPVLDPLVQNVPVPAGGTASTSVTYLTFASCTASALSATVTVSQSGTVLATRTATLAVAAARCSVSYVRESEWAGGFVALVTIANTGPTAITGWTLTFAYPGDQHVSNSWNATITQTGASVSATNLPFNRVIAAGASAAFGILGTWHTSDASPTAFTLNGGACPAA